MFNAIRNLFNIQINNGLHEKMIIGCTTIGLVGGSLYGASDSRRCANTSFKETIQNTFVCGCIGLPTGFLVGILSPIVVPVCTICGLIGAGVYGYNKINPVIPWHKKLEYKGNQENSQDNEFITEIKNTK